MWLMLHHLEYLPSPTIFHGEGDTCSSLGTGAVAQRLVHLCAAVSWIPFALQVHGVQGHGMLQPSGEWEPGLSTDLDSELEFQVLSQIGFHELQGFFSV